MDALARRKLARAAARLNAASAHAGRLPPLALMTDDERLADPLAAAAALPRGSLVIVRARDKNRRAALATQMLALARTRHLFVLVASDPELALTSGADGIHLPTARLGETAHWRTRGPRLLVTAAAHSLADLSAAGEAHVDAAFLSPVFETKSHPDRAPLTAVRANALVRSSRVPVYALGGITAENARALTAFTGIAAIGALEV